MIAAIKKHKNHLSILLITLLAALLVAFLVRREYQMQNQATYDIHLGAPRGHFNDLGQGLFLDEQDNIIVDIMPDSVGAHDLGRGSQASSWSTYPIPSKLYLLWFSLTDNQFYEGTFELPPKQELAYAFNEEKILDVFNSRVGKMDSINYNFTVNLAPEGRVYLYLRGSMIKLIGSYQATPIYYDWEDWNTNSPFEYTKDVFIEGESLLDLADPLSPMRKGILVTTGPKIHLTREEVIAERREHYRMLVPDLPNSYNKGYFDPVQISLRLEGEHVNKLVDYEVFTLNGEIRDILNHPEDNIITSIPTKLLVDFEYGNQLKRYDFSLSNSLTPSASKSELYQFYQNNFDPKRKVEIVIDIPNEEEAFVYFQQGDKRVEFDTYIVERWSEELR